MIATPPIVKKLFDRFPLTTYEHAGLPLRSRERQVEIPTLLVYAYRGQTIHPDCLLWETLLQIHGTENFKSLASSPHASVSGLPLLLLPSGGKVHAAKLDEWAGIDPLTMEQKVFRVMLNANIRRAYLFTMYMEPRNAGLASRLFIDGDVAWPASLLVRHSTRSSVHEVLAGGLATYYSKEEIYADADAAWAALSALLGNDDYFASPPGLLDAAVFSYTHLILSLPLDFSARDIRISLSQYKNLIAHHERIDQLRSQSNIELRQN